MLLVAPERTTMSKPSSNSRAPPVWNLTQQSNFKKLEENAVKTIKGVYNTLTGEYENVEVSEEVYLAYTRTNWKTKNNSDAFFSHEIQMSSLIGGDDNYENFHEFVSKERETEDTALSHCQSSVPRKAVDMLPKKEKAVIGALFFDGITEREYAKCIAVSQVGVHRQKQKALQKLKEILQKNI